MKKYFLLLILLVICSTVIFADDSNFINALTNCSPYSESGVINTEGMNVQSSKKIVGREGSKCVYKERVNFSGINSTVTCKLTQPQISELVSVMKAYSLVQKYSNNEVDTSSLDAVQNNPVVKVWNKYLQDTSTCTTVIEK